MPNWCYTEYVFKGEPKEIDLFYNKVNQWSNDDPDSPFHVDNDFGNGWLGNIINGCMQDREAYKKTRCRGTLQYNDVYEPGRLSITTETAWCAAPLMWLAVIKKLGLTSVKMAFFEEEPGMGLFNIFDPDGITFDDMDYQVDIYSDVPEELEALRDELVSKSELVKAVNKLIPGDGLLDSKIEEICDRYDCSINKIDRINSLEELWNMYAEDGELEVR